MHPACMNVIDRVVRFAAHQHGVVARHQVARIGVCTTAFDHAVRRGGWQPLHRGVWLMPGAPLTEPAQVRAAALAVPTPGLVTASAALWLNQVLPNFSGPVQVLVPAGSAGADLKGVEVIQCREFPPCRARLVAGVRTVTVARAIVDIARDTDESRLITTVASAARLRRCSPEDVRAEAERRSRFAGRGKVLRAVQQLTGELSHSNEERYARKLLREAGLRFHPEPYPVRVNGRIIAEVDIARPDLNYGVEVDGPSHLLPEQAAADRARDRRLARHNWMVDRFLSSQIRAEPDGFVAEVAAALQARSVA